MVGGLVRIEHDLHLYKFNSRIMSIIIYTWNAYCSVAHQGTLFSRSQYRKYHYYSTPNWEFIHPASFR